ncbi:MAG: arginine--tRNA ligase, partial [Clostridia bacterium]|nr:arginine--tRNA ligase [Clostridia bacterium]
MLTLKKQAAEAVSRAVEKAFSPVSVTPEEVFGLLEYPPDTSLGDLALPCFKFSKTLRRSPVSIAETLAKEIASPAFSHVSAVNGYLNFRMNAGLFVSRVVNTVLAKGDKYGSPACGEGKTVVFDYSSPNVAKPFHIGHLGTTVIGHSLKLLHEFAGYRCVGINYLGDWGTQFGKLIVAYKKWGNKEEIEKGGVDALVALYVRVNNEIQAEEEASVKGYTEEEAAKHRQSALADEARREFSELERGNEENLALWKWFVSVSLEEYQKTYRLLHITFDSYKGESFYTDKIPEQVQQP